MGSNFKMSETQYFGARYFPVLFASILFTTTIISFIIALLESDITPWFPAISDTATKSPESNIFSQLVNISTFIGLALMYIRYLQIKRDVEWLEGSKVTVVLNKHSLPIGLIAMLGCSIAANFPVSTTLSIIAVKDHKRIKTPPRREGHLRINHCKENWSHMVCTMNSIIQNE